MIPLYLKVGAGLAALYVLLHKSSGTPSLPVTPEPIAPPDVPPAPPAPEPPTPVPPDVLPSNLATATVSAHGGLNLRAQPTENGVVVGAGLPYNSWVAIVDQNEYPPTNAAPLGWAHVQTPDGRVGFVSYEYLLFGTAKERGMTPEEEQAYHEHKAEHEAPIFQGAAFAPRVGQGLTWHGPRGAGASRGVKPARVLAVTRLRTSPNGANAIATVPAGEIVQVLGTNRAGWVLARYRDRHAPRAPVFEGWVPASSLAVA